MAKADNNLTKQERVELENLLKDVANSNTLDAYSKNILKLKTSAVWETHENVRNYYLQFWEKHAEVRLSIITQSYVVHNIL